MMNACKRYRPRPVVQRIIAALLLCSAPIVDTTAVAAPITSDTALPVAQGAFTARVQLVMSRSGDDPSGADRDRTEVAVVTALGYGLTGRWALFGVLPYREIDLEATSDGQRVARRNQGFGDLSLFARYTAYQHDQPGKTFRIAPFAGVEAPTGEDDARDALGTLPTGVQVGSGSWNMFGGVVLTWQTLQYQFDGQLSYRANTEAKGFEAGDIARLDGSLQHRVFPRQLASGTQGFLYAVIEANLIHQSKDRVAGRADADSGGTRLFLAPGIQYVTTRWIAEGAVQLPVAQDMNGTALENDYIVRVGARFNF